MCNHDSAATTRFNIFCRALTGKGRAEDSGPMRTSISGNGKGIGHKVGTVLPSTGSERLSKDCMNLEKGDGVANSHLVIEFQTFKMSELGASAPGTVWVHFLSAPSVPETALLRLPILGRSSGLPSPL